MMKPGTHTTEFWLALLSNVISSVMASGVLVEGSQLAQIVGVVGVVVTNIWYAWMRTSAKKQATTDATVALGPQQSTPFDVATVIAAAQGTRTTVEGTSASAAPPPSGPSPSLVAGSLVLGVAVAGALVTAALTGGCGPRSKAAARNAVADTVDCTTADRLELEAQFGPTVEQAIARATGDDGKVDLPSLRSATSALKRNGWCVVEKTVDRIVAAIAAAVSGAPQSSPLEVDAADLAAKVAQLRREKFGATTFAVRR